MIPKRLLIGLVSLLLMISSACQKDDASSCSYPKNAKLKRIVVCNYVEMECPSRECDDIAKIEEEYEYDSMGRIVRVLLSPNYENGVLTKMAEYHLYEYNSAGQLIKIQYHVAFRDDYAHYNDRIYTYSNNGKKIKEYNDYSGSDSFQYSLFHYENNRLKRIESYKKDSDELDRFIENEYDNSGNLIKETTFDTDSVPLFYYEHLYENGLNTNSYLYSWGYTKHSSEFIKTYDENGNLIMLESFYGSGSSKGNENLKYEYYL